ncbi:LmbE family protein [Limnochorda pilosa]|uniref:LmbE family protein n=2 Tax=Limnochorda pilosa TaxID=1555112 RepID=A0A0K2SG71_LIMPI|nr:LmbE family protein [Limnochorda pilosa]
MLPVPDLLKARRILCVQPHPDDVEVGAGGTIARLTSSGATVAYVTVTDGGLGSLNPRDPRREVALRRRREQEEAARILGVSELRWLDFPDGGAYSEDEVRGRLLAEIARFQPETVLTVDPWLPYEAHPDHRKTGFAAVGAALLSTFPGAAAARSGAEGPAKEPAPVAQGNPAAQAVTSVALCITASPNTFIDVTTTWERKMEAIRAHASQFPEVSWPFFESYFSAKAAEYGRQVEAERAEAFKVLAPVHLHVNPDAMWI